MTVVVSLRSLDHADVRELELAGAKLAIGRAAACEVRIPAATEIHARVDVLAKGFAITPLADTTVNTVAITSPTRLGPDDVVEIARTMLRLRVEGRNPSMREPAGIVAAPKSPYPMVTAPWTMSPPATHLLPYPDLPPLWPVANRPQPVLCGLDRRGIGGGLLTQLDAAVGDPTVRLVYADWVESQGYVDHARYVRGEPLVIAPIGSRFVEVCDEAWRAIVGCGPIIHPCPHARAWHELAPRELFRRRCATCQRDVVFATSTEVATARYASRDPFVADVELGAVIYRLQEEASYS